VVVDLCRHGLREVGSFVASTVVLALLVVVALGPALGPLVRQVAASDEHACACGMKPGTCGCPECARLLAQDDAFHLPSRVDALGSCDDHGLGPLPTPLPLGVLPSGSFVALTPPAGLLLSLSPLAWSPAPRKSPPTPPPRRFSV